MYFWRVNLYSFHPLKTYWGAQGLIFFYLACSFVINEAIYVSKILMEGSCSNWRLMYAFADHSRLLETKRNIQTHTSEGFFTEGCFALVEGTYTDEEILIVNAIGHPPCERRAEARYVVETISWFWINEFYTRSVHGHIDFLGKGATTVLEDVNYSSGCASIKLIYGYRTDSLSDLPNIHN